MTKLPLVLAALAACGEPGDDGDTPELITTVQLVFVPPSGPPTVAKFDDPDGDGGDAPVVDPVNLTAGASYTLTVTFLNRLGTVDEDITLEVRDEGTDHQVFFTGTAVNGPATNNPSAPLAHSYGDVDANFLPVGLTNTIAAQAGTGTLTVRLQHMPAETPPGKTAGAAEAVKTGGFSAIGGEPDVNVDFAVTVQ